MTNGNGKQPDVMAPHSVEAEESVLGSILLNPDSLYEVVHFLEADDFFIVRNGWVFEAFKRLVDRGESIDVVTITAELERQNRLSEVGGPVYIGYLVNQTPSSIFTETYGRIIERAAIRRRMLEAASAIAQLAHQESDSIDHVLSLGDQAWYSAAARKSGNMAASIADVAPRVGATIADRVKRHRDGASLDVVESGYPDLDRIIGGFDKEHFVIVAGRPGSGKSSFLICLAHNRGKQGKPCGIYSLEMSKEQIVERLIAMDSQISSTKIKQGDLTDKELARVLASETRVGAMPIQLCDPISPDLLSFKMQARVWRRKHEIDVLFVDYLQLFKGEGMSDEGMIASISREHKMLARELGIPIVSAAQLSRKCEERQNKRPLLSDLRGSGTLEQDGDTVIFIYRDDMYNENTLQPNQAEFNVAKQRNGPTGIVSLFFRKELTMFSSLSKTKFDFAGSGDGHRDTKRVNAKGGGE
ncbi:MAG: replicative DNA helicase [Planctomycetota bacterium]|jgi:replicative DNA helicase